MPDLTRALKQVRVVVTDVDGTLTDGGMFYTTSGDTGKRFDVRDGMGVRLLQLGGIEVAFVSSDTSRVISDRAARLDIRHCYLGKMDKVETLETICREAGCTLEEAAFVGDDLQDLSAMEAVGVAAAVADADPAVREAAVFVCTARGGHGAFREFAEALIQARGLTPRELWEGRKPG